MFFKFRIELNNFNCELVLIQIFIIYQKKETQKGKNIANKEKDKKILEDYKKEQEGIMKNKKEHAKKLYEKESKMVKTVGNEVSTRNKKYYLKLKKDIKNRKKIN